MKKPAPKPMMKPSEMPKVGKGKPKKGGKNC